jgi:hypothetical protein
MTESEDSFDEGDLKMAAVATKTHSHGPQPETMPRQSTRLQTKVAASQSTAAATEIRRAPTLKPQPTLNAPGRSANQPASTSAAPKSAPKPAGSLPATPPPTMLASQDLPHEDPAHVEPITQDFEESDGTETEEPETEEPTEAVVDRYSRAVTPTVVFKQTFTQRATELQAEWSNEVRTDVAVKHMARWFEFMHDDEFDPVRELETEAKLTPGQPIAFLFAHTDGKVYCMHSLGTVTLYNRSDKSNGHFYGFVGDLAPTEDGWTLPAILHMDSDRIFEHLQEVKIATIKDCEASGAPDLVKVSSGARRFDVSLLLPIPPHWLPAFVVPLKPKEVYNWMRMKTKLWKMGPAKQVAEQTMTWCRSLRSLDKQRIYKDEPRLTCSRLTLPTFGTINPNRQVKEWAARHLLPFTRSPFQETIPPPPEAPPAAPPAADAPLTPRGVHFVDPQALVLAQLTQILSNQEARHQLEDERRRETESAVLNPTTASLPEATLCNLLGFAGLSWENREELNPIFSKIAATKGKPHKYAILRAFFKELADEDPSFTGFSNTRLLDSIINHNLAPGLQANTAHHGLSPLAFVLQTAHDIKAAEEEDEIFADTTFVTMEVARQRKKTKAPPLPITLPDLLNLLRRWELVLCHLFPSKPVLWRQSHRLWKGLTARQHTLIMDEHGTKRLIANVLFAITSAAQEVFSTSMTRAELEGTETEFPTCSLCTHVDQFLSGSDHQLSATPAEWKSKPRPAGGLGDAFGAAGLPPQSPPESKRQRPGEQFVARGDPRRDRTKQRVGYINQNGPKAFADSSEMNDLIARTKNLTLRRLCEAANIPNPVVLGEEAGVDPEVCLLYNCLGFCKSVNCRRKHINISEGQADALMRRLKPGVVRMLRDQQGHRS